MFFPDVRLKKYIEIRPADSMPIKYVLAYATLIKGIFMSDFSPDVSLCHYSGKEQYNIKGL